MSLWKRGKVWWTQFYIDGIRHQESTQTSGRRLAERIAQKLEQDAVARKNQLVIADPEITVGALIAHFIAAGGATAYHLGRINELLKFWPDIRVASVNRGMAEEYRLRRHREKQVSDATINRDLSVLRKIFNWGVDNSLLVSSPFTRLRLVRERRTKKRILAVGEEGALLTACADHFRTIVTVALDCGMRRGELLKQRLEDVDFERKLLFVACSKTPEGESREIPLSARVYEVLAGIPEREGLVFTYDGRPILNVKTAWKSALRRSGVRPLRFHDLRCQGRSKKRPGRRSKIDPPVSISTLKKHPTVASAA